MGGSRRIQGNQAEHNIIGALTFGGMADHMSVKYSKLFKLFVFLINCLTNPGIEELPYALMQKDPNGARCRCAERLSAAC